jgi:hypothetical protein
MRDPWYSSATGLPWHLTRRDLLCFGGLAAIGGSAAAAGLLSDGAPPQAAGPNYKSLSYTGAGYAVGSGGLRRGEVLVDGAKAFAQQTGVDVKINPQPWTTPMEKIQADIRSGSPTYDIFWSDLEFAYTLAFRRAVGRNKHGPGRTGPEIACRRKPRCRTAAAGCRFATGQCLVAGGGWVIR